MRKPATRVISGIGLMIMCLAALLAYNLNRLGDIANGMGALCVDIDNFSIFTMVLLSACFSFTAVLCLGEILHAIDVIKKGQEDSQFILNAFILYLASLLIVLGGSLYMGRFCL